MTEILIHTIEDTLLSLPLLFFTYLILEYVEHKEFLRHSQRFLSFQRYTVVGAALFGLIPQCGFALIAASLYVEHAISLGTLFAVFIATSDEAIPVLLANPNSAAMLGYILIVKWMIAVLVGYTLDALLPHTQLQTATIQKTICSCHSHSSQSLWRAALQRTLKVFAFLFVVSLLLHGLLHAIGEDHLASILLGQTLFQPFLAALIGLIPNCASSVLLAQLYASQILSFGALLAGLISNAGLGLMVLYRTLPKKRQFFQIALLLLLIAGTFGFLFQLWC